MAVRLRLKRIGRRFVPVYRVVAVDRRRSRDSVVIEELGHYDPRRESNEQEFSCDRERVAYWLSVGAQPSETVRDLLSKHGIGAAGRAS
ncbi:MAG: 30S ribosomal protein S16 [Phycisphaerae bacterium]|nr:30S ribosomal protein S16 [Phycisphaerae bacterium]